MTDSTQLTRIADALENLVALMQAGNPAAILAQYERLADEYERKADAFGDLDTEIVNMPQELVDDKRKGYHAKAEADMHAAYETMKRFEEAHPEVLA